MNCPCGKPVALSDDGNHLKAFIVERRKYCSKYCMRYYNRKRWNEQNRLKKNAASREYYKTNREWIRARENASLRRKEYDKQRKKLKRQQNPDYFRELAKRQYLKDRDKIKARVQANRQADPETYRQRARMYTCKAKRQRMESEFALLALQLSSVSENTQPTQ